MLRIVSPIPPSINKYLSYKIGGVFPKQYIQTYKSAESVKYENMFAKHAKFCVQNQDWVMPEKDKYIIVRATFYFPKHGMDVNNHWKLPLDAFKIAGVYLDDSKVVEGARRVYIDAKSPRIEFDIWEAPYVGIFNNSDEFESFKNSNCRFCKKNPQRCKVITQSLQNRITDDINMKNMTCNLRKPK